MDRKICQNIKPPTPTHIPSSVYTTKHLGKIRRLGYKQFYKCPFFHTHFFILTALRRSSLRLLFLIKIVCSFYFLRIIDYGIE